MKTKEQIEQIIRMFIIKKDTLNAQIINTPRGVGDNLVKQWYEEIIELKGAIEAYKWVLEDE